MTTRLSLDRFEGNGQQVAVLLTDDGRTLNLPRAFVPKDARPGAVLTLALEVDHEATRRLAQETQAVQDQLKTRDHGGDLKL